MTFSIKQTNIAKGVACLLLILHHLFYNDPQRYAMYHCSFVSENGIPYLCLFAGISKVCVSIFLILSGYGLYKSYNKKFGHSARIKPSLCFSGKQLVKLLMNFWFIFIIFVPLGFFLGRNPVGVYSGGTANAFINAALDFFGIAKLFNTPTMNATWWFMSAIILLYILFPLFLKATAFSKEGLLLGGVILYFLPTLFSGFAIIQTLIFPFVLGMISAQMNLFERIHNGMGKTWVKVLVCSAAVLFFGYLRYRTIDADVFFAYAIILFSFAVLSRIPGLRLCLSEIGRCSGDIFLFHTFIYGYYFSDFIRSFKYPAVVYLVMVIVCYAIALLLDWLKGITKYQTLILKLTKSKRQEPNI